MSMTTRFASALLILLGSAQTSIAQESQYRYVRPVYHVAYSQAAAMGMVAPQYATQQDGSATLSAPAAPQSTPGHAQETLASDPYGFAAVLNHYRAMVGLPPVAYDPNLSAWAWQNNAAQSHRGLGHHVNPNCLQNCGWNYSDAWSVAQGWMNSPGHRRNMLSPSITRFGIAYGPGPYWTMNAL